MRFNFVGANLVNYPSKDLMKDEKGDTVSVLHSCQIAMLQASIPEERLNADQKLKNFKLGMKLVNGDSAALQLTSEEVTLVKQRVCGVYPTIVAGQVDAFFENDLDVARMIPGKV